MATQRQELAVRGFDFNAPSSLSEAQEHATIFASSGLCPERFRGKPSDVLIVIQTGRDMGLKATQALRCLYVVNGMPAVYGDGLLALVRNHPLCEDIKEWFEGSLKDGTLEAFCTFKRKGCSPSTESFSIDDAKRAGLWMVKDNWKKYPQRMLKWRARTYAAKDAIPEAFYNLRTEDELENMTNVVKAVTSSNKGMRGLEESLGIAQDEIIIEGDFIATNEASESISEPELTDKEALINELNQLIIEKKITQKVRDKWCSQFNVNVINDLPVDNMKNIIKYYKEKK